MSSNLKPHAFQVYSFVLVQSTSHTSRSESDFSSVLLFDHSKSTHTANYFKGLSHFYTHRAAPSSRNGLQRFRRTGMGKGLGLTLIKCHRLHLGLQRGADVHEDVELENGLELPEGSHGSHQLPAM